MGTAVSDLPRQVNSRRKASTSSWPHVISRKAPRLLPGSSPQIPAPALNQSTSTWPPSLPSGSAPLYFRRKAIPLHLLINHAGGSFPGKQARFTADGFELTIGTNHLGHFLLTNLLIEDLKRSAPARVITVSSQLHIPGYGGGLRPDFDDENLKAEKYYNAQVFYKNAKLANIWFAYELQRRLAGSGVTSNAVCPGFVPRSSSPATSDNRTRRISTHINMG